MRKLTQEFAFKQSIVEDFFISTADDNYVAARWCYLDGLNIDFFWLSVHSLEKYLKAALLLNCKSAIWPAPGSEDTKFGVTMGPEVGHGASEVYAGVQA
jgi:hypothetical protein